jgi:hypothetical protein
LELLRESLPTVLVALARAKAVQHLAHASSTQKVARQNGM